MNTRGSRCYASVPHCESWIIPFGDYRDRDEFDDLLLSIRLTGPKRFNDAIQGLRYAMGRKTTTVHGARLYIGTDIPEGVTMILSPDTREQVIEVLTKLGSYMTPRGVVPWGNMAADLMAIRDRLSADPNTEIPSLGIGMVIEGDIRGTCTIAQTSWIGDHL